MKIYAVSTGEYSDFSYWEVFDEEIVAQKWADVLNKESDHNYAEVHELKVRRRDWARTTVHRLVTAILPNGDVLRSEEGSSVAADPVGGIDNSVSNWGERVSILTRCDGADLEKARKIHSDTVAKVRAERMGL